MEHGYEFFSDRKFITIFSSVNYEGKYDNDGAMLRVDENLVLSFVFIKGNKTL